METSDFTIFTRWRQKVWREKYLKEMWEWVYTLFNKKATAKVDCKLQVVREIQ